MAKGLYKSNIGKFSKNNILTQSEIDLVNDYVSQSNNIELKTELNNLIDEKGIIYNKPLYRSIGAGELGISKDEWREIMSSARAGNDAGKLIENRIGTPQGFMSTANNIQGTSGFMGSYGQMIIRLDNTQGKKALDISKISNRKNEHEVLFGQKYKI